MKILITLTALLSLSACAEMTPNEKKWTYIAAGVVVAGAVTAHELDNGGRKNDCPQDNCGHMVQIPGP